jgi:UDP-2-acetamido-3-amino-2,3-dideoxy-glucuronate N-acetyltransferase
MTQERFFKHETACVESQDIGSGTRIWAFAHVMSRATIGENCNICDHCFIESGAVIGNNVTIKNGVSIWDKVIIEDGAFIGPNAAFTNDLWPRSRNPNWQIKETVIGRGASIGANATILCGIHVGAFAMIGAGAVLAHDLPDHALCYGNPARIHGWVCVCSLKLEFTGMKATCGNCGKQYRQSNDHVSIIEPNGKISH